MTLIGLIIQRLKNEKVLRPTIRHIKETELSGQVFTETIAVMSTFLGLPAMAKATTLAVAVLSPNKEEDR
tara:strand:+ start:241 stop:450 length:210 start_codon:yes stop_codon:yes gene_type:complete